ncbi:MAG: hypothetical protein ABIO82_04700 [Ginsengibacter sp.]
MQSAIIMMVCNPEVNESKPFILLTKKKSTIDRTIKQSQTGKINFFVLSGGRT